MDDRVRCHNAKFSRIDAHNLELHGSEASSDKEEVSFPDGSVGLKEVGLEVRLEEISCETFDGVVEREDVDALAVRNISTSVNGSEISQSQAKVLPDNLVHSDLPFFEVVVSKDDAECVVTLLSPDQNRVTLEQLELFHLLRRQRDHGVIVIDSFLDNQPVGGLLLLGLCGSCRLLRSSSCGLSCRTGHVLLPFRKIEECRSFLKNLRSLFLLEQAA
mmetsp:Transcript_10422/g.20217  ORF Transcript_10422/g.20217 Transcript_10422/m.20217 type:complete len:217 (-) Transcript_10422:85-735(-)